MPNFKMADHPLANGLVTILLKYFMCISFQICCPSSDLYDMESCLPACKVFFKFARDLIKTLYIWEEFYMKHKNVDSGYVLEFCWFIPAYTNQELLRGIM